MNEECFNPTSSSLPDPDSQLDFFLDVLQATIDSNHDPQIVYPLLQTKLHLIDDNFAQVLRQWAIDSLSEAEPERAYDRAVAIGEFSILLDQFPLGNRAINLEIAITGYEVTSTVFTYQAFPQNWAVLQSNLGLAYTYRIRGERAENLEAAIRHYSNALQEYTREAFAEQWAIIHNNLGIAYRYRIRGERAENLEAAISCYLTALEVRTREALPEQWAMTQNNLGEVYRDRIQGERAENLEAAINCYLAALEIRTCEAFPEKWAETQNNLGLAYEQRIRGNRAENLDAAISCHLAALKVRTREALPELWSDTQNNLGIAYRNRIRGERAENWEAAISCYLAALEVRTRQNFPEKWAMTQDNLGLAHWERIRGEKEENLEIAIYCHLAALEVRTRQAFPELWADTQNNLGAAYTYRIRGERAENLEAAIHCYLAALEVRSREAFPTDHARTQFNLGRAYQDARQIHNAYTAFAVAIETIESQREEIVSGSGIEEDKKKLAEQWNQLYQGMVEVCLELAKNKPKYYNQAIEYVERSKARNLVELLVNKNLYPKHDLYPNSEAYQTHCDQLDRLRREIPAKQRRLESLISSKESEERYRDDMEQRQQELNNLRQQRDELLGEINQVDSSFTFTQKVEPIPFSSIQALTDDNSAIIECYYIANNQLLTFIITRHHPYPIVVSSSPEDMKALEDWDKEYQDAYRQQKSQQLANLGVRLQHLFAKILRIDEVLCHIDDIFKQKGAKCERLIMIPHRYLHLLPLHALPLANGDFLCDRFSKGIGYTPSCQLLQLTQKQERPVFSNFFAIQNPADDLLYTNLEVETISSSFPSAQVLVKQEATKAALNTSHDLPLAHCNHFSCHGEFNSTSPLESALLLANNERLTLREIFGLTLNQCRLVTLSACETGLTDPTSISDEYIGLPSGFLYAGSPSVVSSLWAVSDFSTSFLMIKFYENFRQSPQQEAGAVADALNQAQKWLRDLTSQEFEALLEKYQPQIEQIFAQLEEDDQIIAEEYLLQARNRKPHPFVNPYYWAAFTATGL